MELEMLVETESIPKYCRICLNTDIKMKSLENSSIILLRQFFDMFPSQNDIFQWICYECERSLLNIQNFKTKCNQVNDIIKNYSIVDLNNEQNITMLNIEINKLNSLKTLSMSEVTISSCEANNVTGNIKEENISESDHFERLDALHCKSEISDFDDSEIQNYCVECDEYFETPLDLEKHIETAEKHREVQTFQCNICNQTFSTKDLLKDHIKSEHKQLRKPYCTICKKTFIRKISLKKHMLTHGEKKFECYHCDKKFSIKYRMIAHVNKVHKKLKITETHLCSYCGMTFDKRSLLMKHILSHTEKKPVECYFCGKKFSIVSNLNRHIRSSHAEVLKISLSLKNSTPLTIGVFSQDILPQITQEFFECYLCGNIFFEKKGLSMHMQLVHLKLKEIKMHPCSHCAKTFKVKYLLMKHMRTHTGEKPYECQICNKKFSQSSNVTTHMKRVHLKMGQLTCTFCDMTFSSKIDLRKHERIHTGGKPYECHHCGKKYPKKSKLSIHIQVTHLKLDLFNCIHCTKSFTEKHSLKRHMRTHTGEKPYECQHCNRRFTQMSNLKSHINTVHSNIEVYQM